MARAARWLASWQRARGATVRIHPTSRGRHVVVAHWASTPAAPWVVVYGHYDVQPAGVGWTSDPFTPVVRAGVLYARGAGDDKGQLFAHLCALDAWRRTGGPPVHVLVVAEGAEEVGSPGLHPLLARLAGGERPRAVVVSDTERDEAGAPTVTVSQRGRVAAQLEVDTGGPAVHPGRLGGAVVDPTLVMAESLLRLRDELVPSLGTHPTGGVGPPLHVRADAAVARTARGRATVGSDLEARVTRGGALSVTRVGSEGPGAGVPARTTARLDLRLPPRADPRQVVARARTVLAQRAPRGTTVTLRLLASTAGVETMPDPAVRGAVEQACAVGFGTPPTYVRSGGTVPAVRMMADAFGRAPVLLGLGTPGGNAHGPDESMDLAGWAAGVDTCAALLAALASEPPRARASTPSSSTSRHRRGRRDL